MIQTLIVPCMRLPSVNELYLHNKETGDVFKNPETVQMIDQMRTFLSDRYPIKKFSWLNKNSRIHISYDFILKRSLWRRDVSNFIKIVQDTVTRYIGIDDSQVLSIYARKSLKKDDLFEYAIVNISDEIVYHQPESDNTIVIPLSYIPSVNSMYGYDKNSHQVFKEPWIHKLEWYVKDYLNKHIPRYKFTFLKNGLRLRCYYDFFLKSLYEPVGVDVVKSRDTDNMIKAIEDIIFKYLKIDDRWVVELYARKHNAPDNGNEYVAFTIEPSDFDVTSFTNK